MICTIEEKHKTMEDNFDLSVSKKKHEFVKGGQTEGWL